MVASDLVRATSQAACAVLLLTGAAHLWELVALQAVYGTARAFFDPAALALRAADRRPRRASAGQQPHRAQRQRRVGGRSRGGRRDRRRRPARMGPGLRRSSPSSAARCACARHAPDRRRGHESARPCCSELRAGWGAFRARRWLWITVSCFTLYIGLRVGAVAGAGPGRWRGSRWAGPGAWAAIVVALGVGSIAGGLVAPAGTPTLSPSSGLRAVRRHDRRRLFALVAAHAPLPVILPVAVIDGAGGTMFNTFWFTAVQIRRARRRAGPGVLVGLPGHGGRSSPSARRSAARWRPRSGLSTTLYGAAARDPAPVRAGAARAVGAQLQPAGGGAGGLESSSLSAVAVEADHLLDAAGPVGVGHRVLAAAPGCT